MTTIAHPRCDADFTDGDRAKFDNFRIPMELVLAAGVRRVTDQQAREYGIEFTSAADLSGLLFIYCDPFTGRRVKARLRRDHPEEVEVLDPQTNQPKKDDDGKLVTKGKNKYLSSKGDRQHLYFPPQSGDLVRDPGVDVILVEAEKSVLALTAWASRVGRTMLIVATGGIWGWRGTRGKAEDAKGHRIDIKGPIPDLDLISQPGRRITIWFDRNIESNPQVRVARNQLEDELLSRGCRVFRAGYPIPGSYRAVAI